jgi:predicted phosphoribosyltransferase
VTGTAGASVLKDADPTADCDSDRITCSRTDAGRRLAAALDAHGVDADVVLAVPRGGLPVGRVVVARKIGAPWNPELAVASDGTVWLNESLIGDSGVDGAYLDEQTEREREAALATVERYRGDRAPLDLVGKTVLVVDDGIATGATTTACVKQVTNAGAERVVVAVPVAPPNTLTRLDGEADEVVCVETPPQFGSVGQFYDSFEQVSDERARAYLDG